MIRTLAAALFVACLPQFVTAAEPAPAPHAKSKVAVGEAAPAFTIKDATGKIVNLAELTAKGPVLVRLTCGCSGCDKELAYFQKINEVYKDKGLISLYVFKEPDAKMAKYAADKKIDVLYAVDTKGDSWGTFQTKSMPTNILIAKGGKIVSIAAGCDPSGLLANVVSDKTGKLLGVDVVDVKNKVNEKK